MTVQIDVILDNTLDGSVGRAVEHGIQAISSHGSLHSHCREVSGVIALGVHRTIGPINRGKFGPTPPLRSRFILATAAIRRMIAFDGFGFTPALIFPYDELDFCR
jgi:hypothetical protein